MRAKSSDIFEAVGFLIFARPIQGKDMAYPATQGKEARTNLRWIQTDAVSDIQGALENFRARQFSTRLSVSIGVDTLGPPLSRTRSSSKSKSRISRFP